MALNLNPELVDSPYVLQRNLRSVEAHINDDYYIESIEPARVVSLGGIVVGWNGANFDYPAVNFLDAVDPLYQIASFRLKDQWVKGNLEATLLYSGDGASTNPIRWELFMSAFPINGAGVATAVTAQNLAGPAVARRVLSAVWTTRLSVNRSHRHGVVAFRRLGAHAADTYAATAYIIRIDIKFISAVREAHT